MQSAKNHTSTEQASTTSSVNATSQIVRETSELSGALQDLVTPGHSLLVTSVGFATRGTAQSLLSELSAKTYLLSNITSHPELQSIESWLIEIKKQFQQGVSNVIGLGGGSVMDVAKILAGLLSDKAPDINQAIAQSRFLKRQAPKLIAIPTTSGTGAEVTAFATLWDKLQHKKHSVLCARPDAVILAPQLTVTLPKRETLYSALDAMSHAVESLWNIYRTPESETLALKALENILDALPAVLADPQNIKARKQLQWAAYHAGSAINITKTAVAHAISYPLTLQHGVPHGLACSFTIPAIIRDMGAERLKIPQGIADKIIKLMDSLDMAGEMAQFGDWRTTFAGDDFYLESSRSKNFIVSVDTHWVKKIVARIS